MPLSRRRLLVQALAGAGFLAGGAWPRLCAAGTLVANVTALYTVEVARVAVPTDTEAVARELRAWPGRVSVGGGRYSMGGQTALAGGLQLDMRQMNRIISLDVAQRRVRVQAGLRWRDLQEVIDPVGLAVQTMQSYANFTIGGSVSVNAHGRYVGNGPVSNSVRALQLVLADGSVVEADRTQNGELFRAALGGYGAVGVITEVELDLVDNVRMERNVRVLTLDDYPKHFHDDVRDDTTAVMHNADLLPPTFDRPVSVTWRRTDKPVTEAARLVSRGRRYRLERGVLWAMTELPGGGSLRSSVVEPLRFNGPAVVWRNHEASLDVAALEPASRGASTYVLQEYFIPPRHFAPFARRLGQVLNAHQVQALNVSIRHSPADALSLMAWAPEEVFSFVLYYKQRTDAAACEAVAVWTRELIDLALAHEGRYYLPYQLHATREQFDAAYPQAQQLRAFKRSVDPDGKFSNSLWARYL